MAERDFDQATRYAGLALDSFRELEDAHGQADAMHRFGLISLQKSELDEALGQFEESLRLDQIAGERPLLRADYERHVGFVYGLEGEYAIAVPFFERSLNLRRRAGATDPAMFAAISLASALVQLERDKEAVPHLKYAAAIAQDIDSAAGRARVQAIVDRLRPDLRQDLRQDTPR
jgi:tetratricopeptide (TPR) repeat protein